MKCREESPRSQKVVIVGKLSPAMKRNALPFFGALAACLALNLQPFASFAQNPAFKLLTIFTNPPTPNEPYSGGNWFEIRVAGLGSDRVLVGALNYDYGGVSGLLNAGEAYLLGTNGAPLATFANPTPVAWDWFGISIVALGSDRILVGAAYDDTAGPQAGIVYVYNTNGALLKAITNPTPVPEEKLGYSMAAVGTDRVLIGAPGVGGAAYLFNTNGALLATFNNPTPNGLDAFGAHVAAVGTDRLLIADNLDDTGAANTGVAYLFSTNGTLLTTITNPAPAIESPSGNFGYAVAAVGPDRILIGAPYDDTGATNAGAAYLFRANGDLLATFVSPTPASGDSFGYSVCAVGSDRVLIGAIGDNTGTPDAGAAYLFNTNGALLTVFRNPDPAVEVGEGFGWSVAAVGTEQVLIANNLDYRNGTFGGAAYLFSPVVPELTIRRTTTNTVAVSWSAYTTGWTLQQNTNDLASLNWSNVTSGIQVNGATRTLITNPQGGNSFYRLVSP